VWREKIYDTIIRMENGEGISRSGWSDENSVFVEDVLERLNHNYAG
jgi:hypothetical protein